MLCSFEPPLLRFQTARDPSPHAIEGLYLISNVFNVLGERHDYALLLLLQ